MRPWSSMHVNFASSSPGREVGALVIPTAQMRPLSPRGVRQRTEVTQLNSGAAGMDPGPLASVSGTGDQSALGPGQPEESGVRKGDRPLCPKAGTGLST